MNILKIEPYPLRRGRKILSQLERDLTAEYRDVLEVLDLRADHPALVDSLGPVLFAISELRLEARQMSARLNAEHVPDTFEQLAARSRESVARLQAIPDADLEARRRLMHIMHLLICAEREFKLLQPDGLSEKEAEAAKQVLLPTDLLYQCHQSLFPAERMIVVSGRARGNQITLGAVFDVTGVASAGHVRADPRKLGQALITMTATGTHLAAWFHSHPGSGPGSTHPSGTDLKQHCDWLRDYSPRLLNAIFVRDGFLRFWGSGLDEGTVRPVLVGAGISDDKGDEHVYRINPG